LARKRLGRPIFNRREGLRPAVGLRRPKKAPSASAKADARRVAPQKADFNRREGLRPAVGFMRRMNSASRGLRPTVGLRRPERHSLRRRRPTLGAKALEKADFNRREGRRPAWGAPNEFGLQGPVANGRPAPTEKKRPPRRQRPTLGAQAPWKANFNRRKSLRPTVGLRRPKKSALRVGKGRRPARSASEGRFQSARSLRPAVGFTRRMNSTLRAFGQRSACADRKYSSRRRRPTPGA